MSTSLTVNPIKMNVGWDFQSTNTFGTNTILNARFDYSKTLANGTGSGNASKMAAVTYTIGTSATQAIDLAASLTDPFGNSITFALVKVIYIELSNATAASAIRIGGGSDGAGTAALANLFVSTSDIIRVRNGGCFMIACTDGTGYAVTATTADILGIKNEDASNTATVNVFICGE